MIQFLIPVKQISLRFSGNSEANASELPENLSEMFYWCYMDGSVCSSTQQYDEFNNNTTQV